MVDLNLIQNKSKQISKKEIKEIIHCKIEEELKRTPSTKMRTVVKGKFEKKSYFSSGLSHKEIIRALKLKLHMVRAKENFRKDNSKCNLCDEQANQTSEHVVYECKGL